MTHNLHIALAQTRAAELRDAAAAARKVRQLTPTVTELPLSLEPTTRDPFLDGLTDSRPTAQSPALHSSDPDRALTALVTAARTGDEAAWTRLVRRFEPGLRHIARSYRLPATDVDDVLQATWLRLYRSLDSVREPAAIAGWLATTTRRECMRLLKSGVREEPTDDPGLGDRVHPDESAANLLAEERRAHLERALATLPARHRRLMLLLACDATSDYRQISTLLGIPRGSIGPIRARCLERLARNADLLELHAVGSAKG
jgi:RNA polymerase sigma factor (sigma-70 family)